MSVATGSYIYTGCWINWSRGAILGSTVSLTQQNGGLLTAFLGIFVTTAGAALWRMLSFAIHQYRVKGGLHDALHHQQQAILRNDSTFGAAWQMTQLAWYWRGLTKKPVLRNLPLILLAVCHMLLFVLAGVFSSEITKTSGKETLIRSPNCGFWDLGTGFDTDPLRSSKSLADESETLTASTYARACYGDVQDKPECKVLPQPKLFWKTRVGAPCPFDPQICTNGSTAAFELDSGLIDSHKDLGINAKQSERVQYRKVTTCAILSQEGHIDVVNTTGREGGLIRYIRYYYGVFGPENFTTRYNRNDLEGDQGYSISTESALASTSNVWAPTRELNRTDADITIIFLAANSVQYTAPVLDPWFKATTPTEEVDAHGNNFTAYRADRALGILACADQYQLCNPARKRCTSLAGMLDLPSQLPTLGMNQIQGFTVIDIYQTILAQLTKFSIDNRGASVLRASDTLSPFSGQIGLPENQWTIEVTEWFAISMAKLQQKVVSYATGPAFARGGLELQPGNSTICQRQKIRSFSGYISFSVLGLSIILTIGTLIIIVALFLDIIVGHLRLRFGWKDHKRLQWAIDQQLQLQRLAYEASEQGHWSHGASAVPVTDKEDLLGLGPDIDQSHPILKVDIGQKASHEAKSDSVSSPSNDVENMAITAESTQQETRLPMKP